MLTEMQVFNRVRVHLRDIGATVLQLVAPGGQAPLGITMYTPKGRRTCYPDLLAYKDGVFLVGEMKPRYSLADHKKILEMKSDGSAALISLLLRQCPHVKTTPEIVGLLCHAQLPYPKLEDVGQWVFGGDGEAIEVVNAPF